MTIDLATQADLSIRLIVAGLLGAAIGLEREVHGHPAGVRTHMLVALGAAVFTVVSIEGFPKTGAGTTDPSRIAAQIVTGIGFLGAGAIVKYGANIRGLTTAASLWVDAGLGLAAGTAMYVVAVVAAGLAIFSLWPVHRLVMRLELTSGQVLHVRLGLRKMDLLADTSQVLLAHRIEIVGVQSEKAKTGHLVELELRLPRGGIDDRVLAELNALPGVAVQSIQRAEEA